MLCRRSSLALSVALLTGCSHAMLQLSHRPDTEQALWRFVTELDVRISRGGGLDSLVDPDGRHGLALAGYKLARERSEELEQFHYLGITIAVVFAGAAVASRGALVPTEEQLERGLLAFSQVMLEIVQREFGDAPTVPGAAGSSMFGRLGDLVHRHQQLRDPKALAEARAKVRPRSGTLGEHLAAEARAKALGRCSWHRRVVSYRLGLLRHKDWGSAEWSKRFKAWKQRIRAGHLVQVGCERHVGLLILTEYDDDPHLRLAVWRFVTPAQWARMEPKLRRKLQLE